MNNEQLKQQLNELFPDAQICDGKQYVTICVTPQQLYNVAKQLKENNQLLFDYLFCQTGIDNGNNFSVVYHLESTKHRHCLVMQVFTESREKPQLPTVCDIWQTAEFHEREIFDLLGVSFTNHPDLRRLFLDENWQGHPLRKDYKDENIIER